MVSVGDYCLDDRNGDLDSLRVSSQKQPKKKINERFTITLSASHSQDCLSALKIKDHFGFVCHDSKEPDRFKEQDVKKVETLEDFLMKASSVQS